MKVIRWLTFIPVAGVLAIAIGFWWASVFSRASFSYSNVWISITGLAPIFLGRVIPAAVFVFVGTWIAPRRNRVVISILGIVGGLYSAPLPPLVYGGYGDHVYYGTKMAGAFLGAGFGMLLAFRFLQNRSKKESNQSVEPTSHSAPRCDSRLT